MLSVLLVGCGGENQESTLDQKEEVDYIKELDELVSETLENTIAAEKVLQDYSAFWEVTIDRGVSTNTIQKYLNIDETQVREYFGEPDSIGYGGTYKSFETVVAGVKKYYTDEGVLDQLKNTSEKISKRLNELNQVPEEYKNYFDKVLELYLLQEEYIGMAINPTGSLITFNQTVNDLGSNIVSKKNEIDVIKPNNESEAE